MHSRHAYNKPVKRWDIYAEQHCAFPHAQAIARFGLIDNSPPLATAESQTALCIVVFEATAFRRAEVQVCG